MIQYILPPEGRFYRANLHCHSTDSDGKMTPEQLVEEYRARGYSILCISDHRKLIDRTGLCREDFLLLNGYEFNHAVEPLHGRSIHLGLIAGRQRCGKCRRWKVFRPVRQAPKTGHLPQR